MYLITWITTHLPTPETSSLIMDITTGVGSGGYAGTPTIYVGDIDMYTSLEKPNT